MKLRRCGKDGGPDREKWDFTTKDGNIWPMYVSKGGNYYGFCPGKATWDAETLWTFQLLIVSAESGSLLTDGGIADQPAWYINLLSWFLPIYDGVKFAMKAKSILGGDSGGKSGRVHGQRSAGLKRGLKRV